MFGEYLTEKVEMGGNSKLENKLVEGVKNTSALSQLNNGKLTIINYFVTNLRAQIELLHFVTFY